YPNMMDSDILIAMLCLSVLINISSLDDFFIYLLACGSVRQSFRRYPVARSAIPCIAVFVANWHEEAVLGRMVEGNLARIPIPQVKLYLGVYPNDTGTRDVALGLAENYPDRVHVVINTLPGPTSKGQMLNEMFRQVYLQPDAP